MKRYYVTATVIVEAEDARIAENIVQNAIEATPAHCETDNVEAVPEDPDDDEG